MSRAKKGNLQAVNDGRLSNFYGAYGMASGANSFKSGSGFGGFSSCANSSKNYVEMYRNNWIAGMVIDSIPEDMTSQGVSISGIDGEAIKIAQKSLIKKQVWADLTDALKWARLFGGSIAVIEIVGEDLSKPLDIKKIKLNSFSSLKVYEAEKIKVSQEVIKVGRDIGKPEFYNVSDIAIHHSRVIKFVGTQLPPSMQQNGFGDSVLNRVAPQLAALNKVLTATAILIDKCRLNVHKITGLNDAVRSNNEKWILAQAQLVSQTQDLTNTTVIDALDNIETLGYDFGGLPDLIIKYSEQISGACGIPVTRLYGQSPSGFNSGQSDLTMYYDRILSLQEGRLREGLERIIQVILASDAQVFDDFEMEFNSLQSTDKLQEAAIVKSNTETIVMAYNSGLLDDAEAKQELKLQSTNGLFGTITQESIDDASAHAAISADLDKEALG
jgi:phage-related protein (TIGR01555 family)